MRVDYKDVIKNDIKKKLQEIAVITSLHTASNESDKKLALNRAKKGYNPFMKSLTRIRDKNIMKLVT